MNETRNRPHLLLITTDQQRWDAAGSRGPAFLRTPHYDHLCREGVRFDRAYSDCPVCVPARTTLMTGRPAHRHGLTHNGRTESFIDATTSLPGRLGAAGYQTMAIGKMHFTPQRARHGFDELLLPDDFYRETQRAGKVQPMRHGLGQNELHPTCSPVAETDTLSSWIAERSVDFITHRRDPQVPFFLWTSFSKPHPPLDPPEPYHSLYLNERIPEAVQGKWSRGDDCPPAFRRFRERMGYDRLSPEIIRAARAAYYGLITQVDYEMGRIFAALRAAGLWDKTVILYTSDHGEYLGDHLAGAKGFFHDASARVPFVLRLPPAPPWSSSDRVETGPVSLADVCPTLLGAAGLPFATAGGGVDLTTVAGGRPADPDRRIVSVYADQRYCYNLAITDGRWKYLWFPEGGVEQFFDLENDPAEQHNLAGTPGVASRLEVLKADLIRELTESDSPHLVRGGLPRIPVEIDPPGFRGAHGHPGYLLEDAPADTRH